MGYTFNVYYWLLGYSNQIIWIVPYELMRVYIPGIVYMTGIVGIIKSIHKPNNINRSVWSDGVYI